MKDFYSETQDSLVRFCESSGYHSSFAAKLLQRTYGRRNHQIPEKLRTNFLSSFSLATPVSIKSQSQSRYDESVKFVLELGDGSLVESVLMPENNRYTLCVSSQVGCAQACAFCYTGRMGLTRNLTAGEIVGQVVVANEWLAENSQGSEVDNVVFMGMGEPLDNVEELIKAIRIMTSPYGLMIAPRKISVSTAGHVDGLKRLRSVLPKTRIALSLHFTDDRKRSKVMPITKKWPVSSLIDEIKQINSETNLAVLIQYTLIAGVNDGLDDARELVDLLKGTKTKVNLIPLNEIEATRLKSPDPDSVSSFRDVLHQHGIRVMIRYSKGQDIAAACGQLVR